MLLITGPLQKKIIRLFRRIIFFCWILFPFSTSAQKYFFDTYSVGEGIAQSTVFDIQQDQYDYVWMGTRAGVSRFNGQEFINYTMDNGLSENGVRIIFRDSDNRLWFGHSGGGVSVYDGHEFRIFSEAGKTFNTDITGIMRDDDQNLWISSEGSGVVKVREEARNMEESEFDLYIGDDLSDRVFGIYRTRDGRLFFITDAFIKMYNPDTNKFTGFSPDGMSTFFLIVTMFEDSRNNLWFGTYHGGLYKYEVERDTFLVFDRRDGLSSNWITTINEDHLGNIWVGTWGGGITVIPPEGKLKVYNNGNGLPDLVIRKIVEDKEGNMLIGTEENGITIFKGENFLSYFEEDGLMDSQVWAILQDNQGRFWFGTNKGISILDPSNQSFSEFFFNNLKGKRIRFIKKDSGNRIYIATDDDGIYTYDPSRGIVSYEAKLNSYLPNLIVTALEADRNGRIWAGTLDGLVSYDYDRRESGYYTQTAGLAGNEITALYSDNNGRLWIGTRSKGINYFENDSIYPFELKDEFTPTCISSDHDGMIWVGTEARGVLVIDPGKKEIIKNLKAGDGLMANLINLIEIDGKNRVYIGTNKGLNVFNPELNRVFSYNQKNGFVGIETRPSAVCHDDDGNLWFGTVAGVTMYNPNISRKVNIEPLTHIISMKVNYEDVPLTKGLKLNYKQNDIIIDYISICLTNPDAVAYEIMLEGADNDWRPTTKQKQVTYVSLAPKKYTFMVRGQNSDGVWNPEPITYSFQIRPPFYKTAWFILIAVFMIVTSIISYIKIRERNLVREKRILEEKVKERTAEVVAQKEELAEKNKDITDSIRYAKRIQVAMLPPEIPFEDTFILYRPKDIVSGDFYWMEEVGDREFLAAVDCTGHGVPGAFMSIIGANILNKIVKEKGIYKPGEILNKMNVEVIQSLKSQDEESTVYDGMDLALVCYNRKTKELDYAGGYNPLLLVRDGDIEEIKADRFGIGRSSKIQTTDKKFTNHTIKIHKGDTIYIFSDGYADQFGGETGKKFKAKPMKELFLAINHKSLEEQREILDKTLEAWRGEIDQVDDVLVIGRRF